MNTNKKLNIEQILQKGGRDGHTIIDVRSEAEFEEDHIPGAIHLPVLDNEERAMVGTIYKQQSEFKARELGAQIISRNISQQLEKISRLAQDKPAFLIYCWRGGMRSKSLSTVMQMIGYSVELLEGGYQTYRTRVHEYLYNEFPNSTLGNYGQKIVSINGYTGSGKTRLIKKLIAAGQPTIDLEALANHRGSLLGLRPQTSQPSQKSFESELCRQILSLRSPVYIVESESRRIGRITLPSCFNAAMRNGYRIWLEIPLALRVTQSVQEYGDELDLIRQRLSLFEGISKATRTELLQLIEQNRKEEAAEMLLREYYDPLYRRYSPAKTREPYDAVIVAENLDEAYEQLAELVGG